MRKALTSVALLLVLSACQEKQAQNLPPAEIQRRADSIANSHYRDLKRQYDQDLEMQIAVEGQERADSILSSRKKTDTLHPLAPVIPDTTHHRVDTARKMPELKAIQQRVFPHQEP